MHSFLKNISMFVVLSIFKPLGCGELSTQTRTAVTQNCSISGPVGTAQCFHVFLVCISVSIPRRFCGSRDGESSGNGTNCSTVILTQQDWAPIVITILTPKAWG